MFPIAQRSSYFLEPRKNLAAKTTTNSAIATRISRVTVIATLVHIRPSVQAKRHNQVASRD
jgi:hypothetical protein